MSWDWVQLLSGAVLFGAALVIAMVASAPIHTLAAIIAVLSMALAASGVGSVVIGYATAESVALAVFFLLAGIVGGYWTTAAALPYLVRHRGSQPALARARDQSKEYDMAVIVVSSAQPERYSPLAVAESQRLLTDNGGVRIPTTAAPFMYLSEKTRYRAIGGILHSREMARAAAASLEDRLDAHGYACKVTNAWTVAGRSLKEAITDATATGARTIVATSLGSDSTLQMARALSNLDIRQCEPSTPRILRTDPLWHSTTLAHSLAMQIIEQAGDTDRSRLGVVLVADGQPPAWEATHPGLGEQENYFAQRVRLHLGEHGIDERHVRMGWLEWQIPDVTETVRHVAALGCTRIIVAPGLIPLPTLATEIDIQHAVRLARLNETVSVSGLDPWNENSAVVDALACSIESVLDRA